MTPHDDDEVVAPRAWAEIEPEADQALRRFELQRAIANKQTTYEVALVKMLCQCRPEHDSFLRLRREVEERTGGTGGVSLSLFREVFPDFPIRILADKLWRVDDTPLPTWFERPAGTMPHKAWCEGYSSDESGPAWSDRPTALVFPWRGLKKFMAVHDLGACEDWTGSRFSYTATHPAYGTAVFVVEPLAQLLRGVFPESRYGRKRNKFRPPGG